MLIESPIGNILTEPAGEPIDWLDLSWQECQQRALRKRTRGGRDVRLLLRLGMTLRHGDVLHRGEDVIVVNVLVSPVLVARPLDPAALASLCYELGSLHVPVQVDGCRVITVPDGPVEAVLDRLGIAYETQTRRFEPELSTPGQVGLSGQFSLLRRPGSEQPVLITTPLPPS